MYKNIQIKPSDVSRGEMIGSGGFGAVYKGLVYKPSQEAIEAAEKMSRLMRSRSNYTTAEYYQTMYEIMSDLSIYINFI